MPEGGSCDVHDIGWAVKQLRNGSLVRRKGWNGKGMFLYCVPSSQFKVSRAPLLGIYPEGYNVHYSAHIDMKTADGSCVPWVCSQSDLLSTDWEWAEAVHLENVGA